MEKNLALMVETRPLPNLIEIIENHKKFLPDNFDVLIFGSQDNIPILYENKIPYMVLGENKIDWTTYNRLLTRVDFWEMFINYNRVLVFQHDSEILRSGIEFFYEWDYTGAPWKFQDNGGNGGLSLRNPRVMYEVCKEHPYKGMAIDGNEDVYFSNKMYKRYNVAPRKACELFSVESIFKLGTFGAHAIDKYFTPEEVNQIRNQYK